MHLWQSAKIDTELALNLIDKIPSFHPLASLILLTILLSACSAVPAVPAAPPPSSPPPTVSPASTDSAVFPTGTAPADDRIDKWALWTNGTQLRGANVWQRVRVPDLDGDLLGDGYVGPPYTQADFDRLAEMGANLVVLSHPGLFTERPPYRPDPAVQENLDQMLAMAQRAGLFAVLSFRTGPGRSDFTFYRDGAGVWFDRDLLVETVWTDAAAQDAWVAMWRYTAERYRGHPALVGYSLMCEPNADEVMLDLYDPAAFYPRYAGTLYDWNQLYPRLARAIREVDSETPILVGGMGWSSVAWLPYLAPAAEERVVYEVHQYAPFQYTHQSPTDNRPYPGAFDITWDDVPDRFDRAWLESFLAPLADFQRERGAPLAVTEFGAQRWAPNAADFLRDEMNLFEARGFNYALWLWNPSWQPWASDPDLNSMNPLYGPDPHNAGPIENDLAAALRSFWTRNRLRP